jgi:pyruvate/2-oxoglutarate dehydrogenase complex dihydrolipoamide dehydrogenase (E3) component
MMEVSGVKMEFGKEVTPELVAELNPNVLILAVGANPCCPKILGANLLHVFMVEDCLQNQSQLGQSVIIVGGGLLGAEIAKQFVDEGKEVTIVEQLDSVAAEAGFIVKKVLLKTLGNNGVKMLTSTRAIAITNEGVVVERFSDKELLVCDSVILAIGYEPRRDLSKTIDMGAIEFYEIGDCVEPRTVMEAIEEGNKIGFII